MTTAALEWAEDLNFASSGVVTYVKTKFMAMGEAQFCPL